MIHDRLKFLAITAAVIALAIGSAAFELAHPDPDPDPPGDTAGDCQPGSLIWFTADFRVD